MRVETTDEYDRWIGRLRDRKSRFRINRYFRGIADGKPITGEYEMVRPRIIEVKFKFKSTPGYRVYVTQEGNELLILLIGGDKSSQARDIDKDVEIAKRWRKER